MKNIYIKLFILFTIVAFTGCTNATINNTQQYDTQPKTIDIVKDITNELISNLSIDKNEIGPIAITSFVQLDKLEKTNHFGRLISESLFNELHSQHIEVADFRGQKGISINSEGEYFISRKLDKINQIITNKYILVGTYTKIKEGILINTRIIDNQNGKVIASSGLVYNISDDLISEIFNIEKKESKRVIKIIN